MKNKTLFVDEYHFAPLGFLLGTILLLPAVIIPLIEPGIRPAGYAVLSVFLLSGLLLFFLRKNIYYDRDSKFVIVRYSFLGVGSSHKYNINDYRSMGSVFLDGGPDYGASDNRVIHMVHYEFVLFGKKGTKDLVLYSVSGGRYGFFPAEKKFKPVEDKMLRHLPLRQESYGP